MYDGSECSLFTLWSVTLCLSSQNVIFLRKEKEAMRAAKNKDIIRYGDIYQSANRTPTSSGQDSILNFNVIDSCELGDVDSWLLVL